MNKHLYGTLNENQLHIDKTECLEKGIVVFPSIYIEGAAASGKTRAVKMLLAKHPEISYVVFRLDETAGIFRAAIEESTGESLVSFGRQQDVSFAEQLNRILQQMNRTEMWAIFEDANYALSEDAICQMKKFIRNMPSNGRAILVGREFPAGLLELLWKREMELIPQAELLFSRNEIRDYLEHFQTPIRAEELYDITGGWPGCVDMMIRFSKEDQELEELRHSFVIDTYIEKEMLGSLSEEEKKLVELARICPWLNETLCSQVWQIEEQGDIFQKLKRKGIFYYNGLKEHYTLVPLFHNKKENIFRKEWKKLAAWYEASGDIREACQCMKKSGDQAEYQEFLCRYYHTIPFLDVQYDEVMGWKQNRPELFYLRGIYSYTRQHFENLKTEIEKVKKWNPSTEAEAHKKREIYLNLVYINPSVPLAEFMELLEEHSRKGEKYHLYSMLGMGHSFLCGLRDVSGLFACAKKEESRQAKIWKEAFHQKEWIAYRLARFDFYMETKQEDSLHEEDWSVLYLAIGKSPDADTAERYRTIMWRFRLAGLYLLCKWPRLEGPEKEPERIHWIEKLLLQENIDLCIRNTESVVNLYSPWWNEPERLSRWLRYLEESSNIQITESNYLELFARAKGYLLLNHYEKAEKILERILPYLQTYHRYRYFAEGLFGMAIIYWNKNKKGQAYRFMMESFLVTGASRYVGFYTKYGKKGREVLEGYIEWLKNTTPEGWHRKKKYNYGNVLRMPMEDYLETLLRGAKKESKLSNELSKGKSVERLTMMETIILQDISRGLSNTEICQEQNLKLPTVKSHIYSLYKKLGVNSRVQAVNKGKEMGIVR